MFRYGLKFSVDVPLFDWEKKQGTLMLVACPMESMRSKLSVQIVAIEAPIPTLFNILGKYLRIYDEINIRMLTVTV